MCKAFISILKQLNILRVTFCTSVKLWMAKQETVEKGEYS